MYTSKTSSIVRLTLTASSSRVMFMKMSLLGKLTRCSENNLDAHLKTFQNLLLDIYWILDIYMKYMNKLQYLLLLHFRDCQCKCTVPKSRGSVVDIFTVIWLVGYTITCLELICCGNNLACGAKDVMAHL